jgi:hypothetical protein
MASSGRRRQRRFGENAGEQYFSGRVNPPQPRSRPDEADPRRIVMADPESMVLAVVIGVVAVAFWLFCLVFFVSFASTWFRALVAGTPVMILDLIRMRLRGTDYKAVVVALIRARQGDVMVYPAEMERAWVLGVDLEKVTFAFIQAKKRTMDVTFDQIVDAELENRLARLLEQGREAPQEELVRG